MGFAKVYVREISKDGKSRNTNNCSNKAKKGLPGDDILLEHYYYNFIFYKYLLKLFLSSCRLSKQECLTLPRVVGE